jgi:S1-C subfamily serine protease
MPPPAPLKFHTSLQVKSVASGSQAETLGVAAGWRVVRLEGARVGTFEEFAAGLSELKAQEVGGNYSPVFFALSP